MSVKFIIQNFRFVNVKELAKISQKFWKWPNQNFGLVTFRSFWIIFFLLQTKVLCTHMTLTPISWKALLNFGYHLQRLSGLELCDCQECFRYNRLSQTYTLQPVHAQRCPYIVGLSIRHCSPFDPVHFDVIWYDFTKEETLPVLFFASLLCEGQLLTLLHSKEFWPFWVQ